MESTRSTHPRFLSGEGELAERIRAFDWNSTSLGPPEGWPNSLRTTVAMMLRTRHPVFIFWGPDLLCLYNDAYSRSLGPEKHPHILGMPGRLAFPELWHIIGPDIEQVQVGGAATWHEDKLVPSYRHGRLDEVYWTYSYAGIDDEDAPNGVGGVLVLCNETTNQVLESRRVSANFQRMAELFERAPVFIATLVGPEHRFEYVNPAYQQLIGDRDVIGKPVGEALPEVIAQGFVRRLDEVLTTGSAYRAHAARVVLARGAGEALEERRLDFLYQPTFDADRTPRGVFAVGVDVTERVLAEQALAFREAQVRLAAEAGEVGFWDVDTVAGTLYWPAAVRAMFGIFTDGVVTMERDFYEGLHPDDRAATFAAFQDAIDPEKRSQYDVEYRTVGQEDAVIRWVAAKGRAQFDANGRCVRVLGTAMDITARKRDEERLRELNETLGQRLEEYLAERKILVDVVEGTDALIQVIDLSFKVLASNRGNVREFENIYGIKPKIGDNLLELLAHLPGPREDARRVWARALSGESFIEEAEFGDPDLSRRWYELHFQPLYSAKGAVVGAFQFGYEVTARRQAEARLAEAEQVVHQAQRMESIGLLTGGVAHDFNNVLQALNAKFELMRRRADQPDSVRTWAASGIELTRKAARVTAQLLAFSKRQTGGDQPVRLRDVLENIHDLLRTTLGPSVRLQTACDDVSVVADATQLEMALLNLAVNARDAMPNGGDVAITGRAVGDGIELAVTDTGVGMSQEVISKAFTPFFTTKPLGKGSGLGLAQVYAMATRTGGTVRIESEENAGTSVIMTLLRAEQDQGGTVPAQLSAAKPAATPARMLVVDDDSAVRRPLVELLKSLEHQVAEAEGGEEALSLLEASQFDILLTDFAMPGMNGVTLANLARAADPTLQVIFMSGYADGDELRDAIGQRGLLLRKPFDVDAAEKAIERALRRRSRRERVLSTSARAGRSGSDEGHSASDRHGGS